MIGKLADKHMGHKLHIRFASGNGRIRQGRRKNAFIIWQCILGPLIDIDNQLPGTIFQLFRYLHTNHFQRFACKSGDFLILRNINDDLHPLQVLGNGQATTVRKVAGSK
jgi:hypothetical protein